MKVLLVNKFLYPKVVRKLMYSSLEKCLKERGMKFSTLG